MTLDEAKYKLSTKISDLKRILRNRKIEILSERNFKGYSVSLNGFDDDKKFKNHIFHNLYREVKALIDYTYIHELDEIKRKKLAMYFVMQFSFKEFKKDLTYDRIFVELNPFQQKSVGALEIIQEQVRQEIIRDLKSEYFDIEDNVAIDFTRIQWNGNRKQLAELFIELEQKKWISLKDGEIKPIANTISQLFFINDGGKSQDINVESFYTIFRPDPKCPAKYHYSEKYQKVYTTTYLQAFNNISNNKDY